MEVLIALWGLTLLCVSWPSVMQLLGTEKAEKKESHGPTIWKRAQPDSGSVCLSVLGGVRGCSLTLPNCSPLLPLLHSARHLKALVMHSSSPATSSVIQFPRQWGCVKFQLRLCVRRAVKTSLPPSCFVCLLLSPHKKQQEPGRWCNLGIYHSGKKWIWILQLSFSRLNSGDTFLIDKCDT